MNVFDSLLVRIKRKTDVDECEGALKDKGVGITSLEDVSELSMHRGTTQTFFNEED